MIAENPSETTDEQRRDQPAEADEPAELTPAALPGEPGEPGETTRERPQQPAADSPPPRPGTQVKNVTAAVEAVLFATDTPLTAAKIAQVVGVGQSAVNKAIAALNERYDEMGAAFHIKAIAGGYRMQTRPEHDEVVSRLHADRRDHKLSQASMETLAIIAYRQPILRADIEAIRGVSCGEVLRNLMDKQLAKIVGRANVLGRPMLYGTTRKFLEVFGLAGLEDLPNVEELKAGAPQHAPAAMDEPPDEEHGEDSSESDPEQSDDK